MKNKNFEIQVKLYFRIVKILQINNSIFQVSIMWDEAIAHFETYRILKNKFIEGFQHNGVIFTNIMPEYKIKNKRIDLVIFIKTENKNEVPFVIIEVKRGKQNVHPGANKNTIIQAKKNAKVINAPYYIITDGERIICFKDLGIATDADRIISENGLIFPRVRPGIKKLRRNPSVNWDDWMKILKTIVEDYLNDSKQ
ncbi:MAG: type I restriction enzyme HsdR N-terminal domain-containing protein [Candidatus Helarchaeota archaeon]